ncbi:cell division topological specificity factor MinE [Oligella ureolytica]|jgi:cell division topological specificity factor|nr:cell division topological specificity factor MinE [Alcaligenaceae bacterium]HZJ97371.1 cell division topological specificity factor MinE [Oligella sp.]
MSLLKLLLGERKKSNSAKIAKERISFVLVRDANDGPDFLPELQKELIEVISKYVKINPEDIKVSLDKQDNLEVLEVKIEMSQEEIIAAKDSKIEQTT